MMAGMGKGERKQSFTGDYKYHEKPKEKFYHSEVYHLYDRPVSYKLKNTDSCVYSSKEALSVSDRQREASHVLEE